MYCLDPCELQASLNLLCTTYVVTVPWSPKSCPDLQDKLDLLHLLGVVVKGHSPKSFFHVRSIVEPLYELSW